jgi:hypothetical protein
MMSAPQCNTPNGHQWQPREFFGLAPVKDILGIHEHGCQNCGLGRNIDDLEPDNILYMPDWFQVKKGG